MTMLGPKTVAFLKALAANNERAWFTQNKKTYEANLKIPAKQFAEELAMELERATGLSHRPKIFRINRDLRFSKDKTPYKTHLHMSFTPDSSAPISPAWMFGLQRDHLVLGLGIFAFPDKALDRWRERVDGPEGEALARQLDSLLASGARMDEPKLKRVPAPYPADHPRASLLRRKGLAIWLDIEDQAAAFGEQGPPRCAAELIRLRAIFDWLREVGG
jgi:uncharacterized protein (TIGR02453 family)